jgi:superfamily II DNA or RNA helicase
VIVHYSGSHWSILRTVDDFGFESYDLVSMPRRLSEPDRPPPLLETSVDKRRVMPIASPAQTALTRSLDEGDNWLSMSTRTLARLHAAFLVAEDPQRRLDARKAATLMHQVSLVQHILERPELRKVLIGDEVGLGKTIEAGLLIRQLVDRDPSTRVLYLAPARLVRNVAHELRDKLDLDVRSWVAGNSGDARLESDRIVVASIHKAVFGANLDQVAASGPWDVIVVDECHHLSDWNPSGGKPNQSFKLVSRLVEAQRPGGRLVLMSGTPHQGSEARFSNILRLLSDDGRTMQGAAGRVIFRTKDRVRDWRGAPLFPAREIRSPIVVDLGERYLSWYQRVGLLYDRAGPGGVQARAAGWAKGQALQWAASSVQAGVGFLARLAMRRAGWTLAAPELLAALAVLRPYRGGPRAEPLPSLYERLRRQIGIHSPETGLPEDGEEWDDEEQWTPDPELLGELLIEGARLIEENAAQSKWDAVCRLIEAAGGEKVVLFAQPVETVTVAAAILEKRFGHSPAIIVGNQSDEERTAQVARFQSDSGPQILVSSRAGGEGLNMQRARRLIHLDVPWNPMELEQRIGRVHRFGSRKTILVDTVVAAGSREVDMYQIARQKLALIARHLDPDQFETLFSRVMSLVPPKELEHLLSDLSSDAAFDAFAAQEIGRLVTEGYRSWSSFDETYRAQAEQVRATQPGEARWADVGAFLLKHGGAEAGTGATFSAFEFQEEEIVDTDEHVPTIRLGERLYACGDTGGLLATDDEGRVAPALGLNLPEVQRILSSFFVTDRPAGVAFLKRPAGLDFLGPSREGTTVFALLRQPLRQERGQWSELTANLHMYRVTVQDETPVELSGPERAALVRTMQQAVRVKAPDPAILPTALERIELDLLRALKRPSDAEINAGVRYAVWPIAVVSLAP